MNVSIVPPHKRRMFFLSIKTFVCIALVFAFLLALGVTNIDVRATGADNVLTMGRNNDGQLGYGTTDFSAHATPTSVSSLSDIISVAAGTSSSFAVKKDGTVWAWGENSLGQLGDNTTTRRTSPVLVVDSGGTGTISAVRAVSSQSYHTLALKWDNTVWAWGTNGAGQLGDNTTTSRLAPVQVKDTDGSGNLTDVVQVDTGNSHSIALKSDGTVWTWGGNSDGQLGDGTNSTRTTPVQVLGVGGSGTLTNVVDIAAGENFSIAVKSDGTVWTWGKNGNGQLGDGTTTNRETPVQVIEVGGSENLTGITDIDAGRMHNVALKADGTVYAWGWNNSFGVMGIGTTGGSYTSPVQVEDSTGTAYLENVTAIFAGGERTFAITRDRKVWGWGENNLGQIGNGGTSNASLPTESTGLYRVVELSTGYNHTVGFEWN